MPLAILFFILVGAISVASAIGVVASRYPVHSALFLLTNFSALAVLYITLNAQFLAAAQVIIYAGGIVILILFVIMLIGSEKIEGQAGHRIWAPYAGIVLGVIMLATMTYSLTEAFSGVEPSAVAVEGGVPEALGMTLYTRYILPFELAAVLLLVALLGALLVGRGAPRLTSGDQPQVE
jgi:NADH-quinone oxidoreductase subunit J